MASHRFLRLLAGFTYVLAAGAVGLLILQNRQLRSQLRLLAEPRVSPRARAPEISRHRLRPGEQPDVQLRGRNGSLTSLHQVSSPGGAYVWLFDPACGTCGEESPFIPAVADKAVAEGGKLIGVTPGSASDAEKFLASRGLEIPLFVIPDFPEHRDGRYSGLATVPQLVEFDACGTVKRAFRSASQFLQQDVGNGASLRDEPIRRVTRRLGATSPR